MDKREFSSIYNKIKESLKNKDNVSLPELQATFDLSYPFAKLAITKLKAESLIIGEPDGMKYFVNPDAFEKRALSLAEAVYFRSCLGDEDLAKLRSFSAYEARNAGSESKYKKLAELGLVSFCSAGPYCTVDETSVHRIASLSISGSSWFELIVALEIACGAKKCAKAFDRNEFTFVTGAIADLVSEFLASPALMMPKQKCGYSMGKFELIESFITKNTFPDIESFRNKARAELLELENLGVTSGVLWDTVRDCIKEFDDLTYDNVEEIRKMLAD